MSGNASRFANLDAGQLAGQIAAVQAAIEAEAEAWLAGAAAGAGQQPLPDGDDGDDPPGGAGPGGGGVPRRLAGLAAKLARLQAAQDRLAERQAVPGAPAARVAAAQDAVDDAARRLEAAEAAQNAKMGAYHAAVAAGKAWRYGKKPVPPERAARVARVARNLATAQARLAAARQAAAASPAKVSATDPDSRLLPAKNGGWLQGWNLQLTAARRQVLLAAELHDNPADAGALVTMIQTAVANCELAGLAGRIRGWLADNGYASAASFAELDHLMLLVAVRREAVQAGRAGAARRPARRLGEDGRPAGHPGRQEPLPAPRRPGRARLRPVLRPVRPLPQLPRPRRRRHRDQAPGHRPQPRQAPGPPATPPRPRHLTRHNRKPAAAVRRPAGLRHAANPQNPARTRRTGQIR